MWRARVAGQAAESADRLAAEANLAEILLWDEHGKHVEAERRLRDLHKVHIRVFGTGHLETLAVQGNLAYSLSGQDKYPEAEAIVRELLGAYTRLLGAEHPLTLKAANHLGGCLSSQGKYAEAETFQRELLEVRKRVLGAAHASTLATASNLADTLCVLNKHTEAEAIQLEVIGALKRVLGAEHPDTLKSTLSLVVHFLHLGKHVEASAMLQTTLASCQRVLGPAHPTTVHAAELLTLIESVQEPPTVAPAAAKPLSAGTRVLVQRLVAKPEHNGKRALVVSFDARSGRYCVALDDGKELSLKAECVAKAGCAAVGCRSEEASSVCARCQAVRYCSRECQRADWKAHKPACAAAHTG